MQLKTTSITTVKKEMQLQEWAAQIEAQQASGLTIREWCADVYTAHSATTARALCHTSPLIAHGQCPAKNDILDMARQ